MAIQGDEANMMLNDLLVAVGNSQFPSDLMMLILSRLPVKSILRFKSVCRAWFALFICPMFIQQQCRIASSSAKINNLLSLFVHTDNLKLGNPIFYLLVDRSCGERTSMLLNPPFECDLHAIQVVGSINGLVCLDFSNKGTSIVLWNPATQKHWRIPNPNLWFSSHESVCVGFAYDDKTDTYKVIRTLLPDYISKFSLDGTYINTVEIYSSGTNTWRTIEADGFPWCYNIKSGTVVSGSAYWYANAVKFMPERRVCLERLMMWFNPSAEGFRFHSIPFKETIFEKIGLSAIGEHPVAYYEMFRREKDETVTLLDIWKLHTCDDGGSGSDTIYGDGESMTIEFVSSSRLRNALGFRGNGEIVALSESAELFICDPHSGQCQLIHHKDASWGWQPKVYDYSESLVSPFRAA